jgi:ABC-type polar amino acid transport system ATPase subunit
MSTFGAPTTVRETNASVVEIRGVTKSYGSHIVLSDLSLNVATGEVVVVIGPSGTGKSTLLRCINGLEPINAGQIFVDGIQVKANSRDVYSVRRKVGLIFQSFNLFPHLTVLQNITLAPRKVYKMKRAAANEQAMSLLAKVGLEPKAHSRPSELSGGEQQRVAIARALATNPRIMLFDEVTSALDPETVGSVLMVMKQLAVDGMGMIVVSHEMGFARDVGHRVIFMEDGTIVDEGSPKYIFDQSTNLRTREFLRSVSHELNQ